MPSWNPTNKQILRHLAAARYFLPVVLNPGDFPDTEDQYVVFLHHAEYELAMEYLEGLGEDNSGHVEEYLFWEELMLAADLMGLSEQSGRYTSRLAGLTGASGSA